MKKLTTKQYKELYRKFKTQQYMLVHKGYAVYNYTFDEFVDVYNEEKSYRAKLTPEERKKKSSILDSVVHSSRIYTPKMAKVMAEGEGTTVSEWKKKTISEVYSGTFLKLSGVDEEKAVKTRQTVFSFFLAQTGDYDIAHANYMTTV